MSDLQAAVDRVLCGEHIWAPMNGYVIVGFTVIEIVREGKPNLDGWDNVAERREIAQFACFADPDAFEEKKRRLIDLTNLVTHKLCSYEILPIQVRRPTQRPADPPEPDIGPGHPALLGRTPAVRGNLPTSRGLGPYEADRRSAKERAATLRRAERVGNHG